MGAHLSKLIATAVTLAAALVGAGSPGTVRAAVLPDDRADVFYSSYKGGGMDIKGKSVLVRKKFAETFSVQAEYFVDTVSGAVLGSLVWPWGNQIFGIDWIADDPVPITATFSALKSTGS